MKDLTLMSIAVLFLFAGCAANQVQTSESKETDRKTETSTNKIQISDFKRLDKKIGKFTKHMEESLFQVTDKGLYGVEVLMPGQNLKVGRNAFYFAIHDSRDNDVSGAEVDITARIPGSDIEAKPGMLDAKPGYYDVSNLVLKQAGRWELLVKMKIGNIEDRVVFDFPDVQ